MRSERTCNAFWPPMGWKHFECIENLSGQSVSKDPVSGKVKGLTYRVDSSPVYYADGVISAVHEIKISGWEYNILGESEEYSILSFFLEDRLNHTTRKEQCISQLKVKDKIFPVTSSSAHRSYMVALLFMKQIDAGNVLDINRVLSMYKVHPTQRGIYKLKNYVRNAFFCNGATQPNDRKINVE